MLDIESTYPYFGECTLCPEICTSMLNMSDVLQQIKHHWKTCHSNTQVNSNDGDPDPLWKRTVSLEILILYFYIYFYRIFLSVLKISKSFVFYWRTSDEKLTSYGQGSVSTDPWKRILKNRILIQISLNIPLTFLRRKQKF